MFDELSETICDEQFLTDYSLPTVRIKEITNVREKRKWLELFCKGYTGGKRRLEPQMFGNICRYFVACIDGKEAGYIRISNVTFCYPKYYGGEVWSATDAYVKSAYRGKAVLREMIQYVMTNCKVKEARLEIKRAIEYEVYYKSLGFVCVQTRQNDDICVIGTR